MTYTFGGPELLRKREQTCAGDKEDAGVYLLLEATARVLVRVPDGFGGAGEDLGPELFEEALRQACAEALIGVEAIAFRIELACVQQFTDGG